jgi:hypothetical protein
VDEKKFEKKVTWTQPYSGGSYEVVSFIVGKELDQNIDTFGSFYRGRQRKVLILE